MGPWRCVGFGIKRALPRKDFVLYIKKARPTTWSGPRALPEQRENYLVSVKRLFTSSQLMRLKKAAT